MEKMSLKNAKEFKEFTTSKELNLQQVLDKMSSEYDLQLGKNFTLFTQAKVKESAILELMSLGFNCTKVEDIFSKELVLKVSW